MEEVARLVWEAEVADIPPVSGGGAVGVLGRWLDGADGSSWVLWRVGYAVAGAAAVVVVWLRW